MKCFSQRDRLVLLALTVTALPPLWWFRDGLPAKGVDSYFSLHPAGRMLAGVSAWDARSSPGIPSTEMPAALLNIAQASLANVHVSLVVTEALTLSCLALLAVMGFYRLTSALLEGQGTAETRAAVAVCSAIVWVANPFTISFVWFHQLLIEITFAVAPLIFWLAADAARGRIPAHRWAPALVLITVLGSAGLPHAYLPAFSIVLVSLLIGGAWQSPRRVAGLLNGALFLALFALGVSWWLVPSLEFLRSFQTQATVGGISAHEQFVFASIYSTLDNVVTLTAIPQIWQNVNGVPYVPSSWQYAEFPGTVLRFAFPTCAAIGAIYGFRRRELRAWTAALTVPLVLGVFISKGLNPPLGFINDALISVPFGDAFRHPVDKLALTIVVPMAVLFAFGLLALASSSAVRPLAFAFAMLVCGWHALPWWLGNIISPGGGVLPSNFAKTPGAYDSVGALLAKAPAGGKTFVEPFSPDGETAYAWEVGVQPNLDCLLQDWAPDRATICHGVGSSYADLVAKTLAQGVHERDPRVFALGRLWGVDRWLVHRDWRADYARNPEDAGSVSAFIANPADAPPLAPTQRDGRSITIPAGASSVLLALWVPRSGPASDAVLEMGRFEALVNRTATADGAYVGILDRQAGLWLAGTRFTLEQWHQLKISWSSDAVWFSVDGVRNASAYDCGAAHPSNCAPVSGTVIPISGSPKAIALVAPARRRQATRISAPVLWVTDTGRPVSIGSRNSERHRGAARVMRAGSRAVALTIPSSFPTSARTPLMSIGSALTLSLHRAGPRERLEIENSLNGQRADVGPEVDPRRAHDVVLVFDGGNVFTSVDNVGSAAYGLCIAPESITPAADTVCGIPLPASIRAFATTRGGPWVYEDLPPEIRLPTPLTLLADDDVLQTWSSGALPQFYTADRTVRIPDHPSSRQLLAAAALVARSPRPALVDSAYGDLTPAHAELTAVSDSPWSAHGSLTLDRRALLIFADTFDPGWQLVFPEEQPAGVRHVVVNGYANGWVVDGKGVVPFRLFYRPQHYAFIGFAVGAVLVAVALVMLIVSLLAEKRWSAGQVAREGLDPRVERLC